jgi:hypothetical protein
MQACVCMRVCVRVCGAAGVQELARAVMAASPLNPFISLEPSHRWTWYNQVSNEISSITALGHLQGDVGRIQRVWYVAALTLEADTVRVSKKVRVVLIRKDGALRQVLCLVAVPVPCTCDSDRVCFTT